MTQKKAQKILEKYNPKDAVVRCPYGRAPVRKLLDSYAKAAVNLYGIISKSELAEIFNKQNDVQTDADEVFALLLPLVLKQKRYYFYKEYIVSYFITINFDYADFLLKEQEDKPRFIPEKEEFLRYKDEFYESETQKLHWGKLHEFVCNEWTESYKKFAFYHELKDIVPVEAGSSGFGTVEHLLDKHSLNFENEEQIEKFVALLTEAYNNTQVWTNKGYSPNEMSKILDILRPKKSAREILIQKSVKISPNAPCPCGSGKKYKKCCRIIEEAKTAQLTRSECVLFYETWYGLLGYVNEQKKVVNITKIMSAKPNLLGSGYLADLRDVLWENPALIDDYINSVQLPNEKVELLKSWRLHHVKGLFILVGSSPEYALVIGTHKREGDRIYGVKGISQSLASAYQYKLPMALETVLLPFKGKIIYDGVLSTMPISFGEGIKKTFKEMYEEAAKYGIITSLE